MRAAARDRPRRQRGFDRVVGVEKLRRIDVCADILDHDIGRVAPAADGDVAIGQRKTLECGRVSALTTSTLVRTGKESVRRVDCFGTREIGLERGGDALLAGGRTVSELITQSARGAGVDPERRRAFRR